VKILALMAVSIGWCWDRFTVLDPTRGVGMASKSERDLLAGRWS
jgi:hypothetical protein